MTERRYLEALYRHRDEVYHLELKGWQMPILHGLVTLAADHPGIKELGWQTEELIAQVRWWCREKFAEWGFSPEEVEYLDKMRVGAQGNISKE